jgi:hypothetical protein
MARHHAIMGHEMGNAVMQKYKALIVERIGGAGVRVPPVPGLLAPRECGDFETLTTSVGCTRAWMTSQGGFDAKPVRSAYIS